MLSKDQILSYFSSVGSPFESGWFPINCPCHDDKHASASGVYDDTGFSFKCHCCGAKTQEVVAELGLSMSDVRPSGSSAFRGSKKPGGFSPKPKPQKMSVEDVTAIAEAAVGDDEPIEQLASILHVRPEALKALGVGYIEHGRYPSGEAEEPYWTFPERDDQGQIVGVNKRYKRGKKLHIKGSARGLIYAPGVLDSDPDLILCPEGGSDVAACGSMGIAAVGRPGNDSGVEMLANFLAPHIYQKSQKEPKIVIMGEWDQKEPSEQHPNGLWPGRDGAIKTAEALTKRLGITVYWCMTPKGNLPKQPKDLRSTISDRYGYRSEEYYRALGARLTDAILAEMVPVQTAQITHIEEEAGSKPTEFVDILASGPQIHYHSDDCDHHGDDYSVAEMSINSVGILLPSQREQEWDGTRLDTTKDLCEIDDDARFDKMEFCQSGITAILQGCNRMAGRLTNAKLGCEKIVSCPACACRARIAKYEYASECFSVAMAAGATISYRYVKPEHVVTVHKAVRRAGYEYKDIELSNGAVLIMIAPRTENGVVLAHKKLPAGFTSTDIPYKLLRMGVANMNVSVSTPVSSSRGWEYEPPPKEKNWKMKKIASVSFAKVTWKFQDYLENLDYDKLRGEKMERSVTGTIPRHWTQEMVDTAIEWMAMGKDIPDDWHRPNLSDLGEAFVAGWTREAA
jgi:hypothetical protein